jgi:membrane protein implicated in regulation of membrane protease activity
MEIINTKLLTMRNIAVIAVFALVALYVARKLVPHAATQPPSTRNGATTTGMTGAVVSPGIGPGNVDIALNLGDPDSIY